MTNEFVDLEPNEDADQATRREQLMRMLCDAGCPEWAAFVDQAIPPSAAEEDDSEGRRGSWTMLREYPAFVASGMRSGRIARPAWSEIERLYPEEVLEAKVQGIQAAADEMEAIHAREQGDDGIDLWDAAQIIRDKLSPKGWPALGIRPRPLDWERIDITDAVTKDIFLAFAHAESTGITYDLSYEHKTGLYDIPVLGDGRYASEAEAMQAAFEHHQRQLLRDLERDVLGGERQALTWFLRAWEAGLFADLIPELAAIVGDADYEPEKRAHQLVRTAIRRALAQGELTGSKKDSAQ